jgi:chemotaxis protein methyltransferase CheR
MLLRTHFPAEAGWAVEVLASDISTKALDAAREGVWPLQRTESIPPAYLRAYMLRGVRSEEGRARAHPALKSLIQFSHVNLNDARYPVDTGYDLIFCRNVLIYFDRPTKAAVVDRLARHLAPHGMLFLGHSETLHSGTHSLRHVGPTAYAPS